MLSHLNSIMEKPFRLRPSLVNHNACLCLHVRVSSYVGAHAGVCRSGYDLMSCVSKLGKKNLRLERETTMSHIRNCNS